MRDPLGYKVLEPLTCPVCEKRLKVGEVCHGALVRPAQDTMSKRLIWSPSDYTNVWPPSGEQMTLDAYAAYQKMRDWLRANHQMFA